MYQRESFGDVNDVLVTVTSLPKIIFKSISTKPDAPWLRQIAIATVRRFFYLTEDWSLELRSARFPKHSGTIVVPKETGGERFEFDGASVPAPWLVSLITVGVLRPLGVLLVASLVHDYAFRYGVLKVSKGDEPPEDVAIERHDADELFREIVTVVNGNRSVGWLAWYFVRLGYWLGVEYNGRPRTGKAPIGVAMSFLLVAGILSALLWVSFRVVTATGLALYFIVYLLTLRELEAVSGLMTIVWMLVILGAYAALLSYWSVTLDGVFGLPM